MPHETFEPRLEFLSHLAATDAVSSPSVSMEAFPRSSFLVGLFFMLTSLASSLFTVVLSDAVAFTFLSSFVALELLDVSSDDELFCSDFAFNAFVSDSNDDEEVVASNIGY
uniref:Uncharacterized protein n=1 Tax=Proboscia inermis TaxID=420281 RepID=A0A7S0GLH3_9STRA